MKSFCFINNALVFVQWQNRPYIKESTPRCAAFPAAASPPTDKSPSLPGSRATQGRSGTRCTSRQKDCRGIGSSTREERFPRARHRTGASCSGCCSRRKESNLIWTGASISDDIDGRFEVRGSNEEVKRSSNLEPVTSSLEPRTSLHPFKDEVVLPIHAQPRVDLLRNSISPIDVEPNAADILAIGDGLHISIESRVHALIAEFGTHVDALNPPHHSVAPVAPLVRNQE